MATNKKAKTYKGKSMRPGGGGSFAKLKDQVAAGYRKKGMSAKKAQKIGGAVAAIRGRKKYGAKKFAQMGATGQKRSAKKTPYRGVHLTRLSK